MKFIYLMLIAVVMQSCFSINNLVEADALGKKQQSHQISTEIFTPLGDRGGWGILEYQFGYGITNNADIRIAFNTNRSLDLRAKYTLYSDDKNAFALGVSADNDVLFVRSIQPEIQCFYSRKTAKYNYMFNPGLEFNATTIAAMPDQRYGPVINLTTGFSSRKDKRWKAGLNLGYIPNADTKLFAGIGLAYDIRPSK